MRPKRKQDKHKRGYNPRRYCCYKFTGNAEKHRNRKMCSRSHGYNAKWNKLTAKKEIQEYGKHPSAHN